MNEPRPCIVFGAFDRHNLGDLLFPLVLSPFLAGRRVRHAGLVARDWSALAGYRVEPLRELMHEPDCAGAHLIHAGGELLDCDAYEAWIMLQPNTALASAIARWDRDPARFDMARAALDCPGPLPYLWGHQAWLGAGRVIAHALGGVGLASRSPSFGAAVAASLADMDSVSVRDRVTADILLRLGVRAELVPDAACLLPVLYGERLRASGDAGEPAEVRRRFSHGYWLVQFTAQSGDDATLARLAAAVLRAAPDARCGIVLYRAGRAPWHDELAVYERFARLLGTRAVHLFQSASVWDGCALLAGSRGVLASSLHLTVLAAGFDIPWLGLAAGPAEAVMESKLGAFWSTWGDYPEHRVVPIDGLPDALPLHLSAAQPSGWAEVLHAAQAGIERWLAGLDG
ncbi:polysaccharide pyruvyl transferase family protein [Chitinivorax sp. PXF-14]|uniref:polysaccharide pyruvyl transferase family protein n=1 Tax=Chitinivorax sp. PXF-14 TaxID=3230488 RepID=UPI003466AC25